MDRHSFRSGVCRHFYTYMRWAHRPATHGACGSFTRYKLLAPRAQRYGGLPVDQVKALGVVDNLDEPGKDCPRGARDTSQHANPSFAG